MPDSHNGLQRGNPASGPIFDSDAKQSGPGPGELSWEVQLYLPARYLARHASNGMHALTR